MGQRIIRVDAALLHEVLKLPPDVQVVDLAHEFWQNPGSYLLKVESGQWPEVADGGRIPEVVPVYRAVPEVKFDGWQ